MATTDSAASVDTPPGRSASADDRADGERHGPFVALRSRPFLLFWTTIALSLTGVWVRITAQGWLVYDLTDDEFLLGLVSFCQAAPVLVASPVAGALLDRVDRRRVLLVVQLVIAGTMFVLATLVASGAVRIWHVMVLAVVAGTASGFDWPARLSLVPSLVPPAHLQSAVALNAAAINGSRVVGPVVAGLLIGAFGVSLCFYLNAVMYLPFIVVLASLSLDRALPSPSRSTPALANLLDGYRYIWRTPTIRGLLSVDVVPLMFGVSYLTLAPAIARDVLGLGGQGLGLLLAANGVGYLAGTLLVAAMSGTRRRGRIVVLGVAGYGVGIVCFALSGQAILSGGLILLLGLVASVYATLNDTLVQTLVDDEYRGRVLAVYSMLWGLTPIGALEAGLLASSVGVQAALAVNGAVILLYLPFLIRATVVPRID